MKTFFAISAFFLTLASAAPLEIRAGPSGSLNVPSGGTVVPAKQPLHIKYTPVNSQGQVTTGIDLLLIQNAKADVLQFPLAYGLSASSKSNTIEAYFNNIQGANPSGSTNPVRPCGQYLLEVTEHQEGPVFTGSFRAAMPTITFQC